MEEQVMANVQTGIQVVLLRHDPESSLHCRGILAGIESEYLYPSRGWLQESGDSLDEAALTCSVEAEQTEYLSRWNLQRKAFQSYGTRRVA